MQFFFCKFFNFSLKKLIFPQFCQSKCSLSFNFRHNSFRQRNFVLILDIFQLLDHLFHVHRQKWAQRVQCGRCNIWLNERADLAKHLKSHPAQVHKCPHCDKISPTANALLCHTRAVHSEATHKCTLCEKVFRTITALKVRTDYLLFCSERTLRWCGLELESIFFD